MGTGLSSAVMKTGTLHRRGARGLTLIELLIVLVIASILMGAGLPAFNGLMRSMKLTNASNDLFASLVLARSEAAKRHARVVLCKSADGERCVTTGGWEQGWIVFHDVNDNGVREWGEGIVSRVDPLPRDVRVSGNLNVSKYISYAPTGETKLTSGAFQAGTVTICSASVAAQEARQVVLNAVGRPRVQKSKVASCP
jgi:type IV fimbrial biogenesis protein FimT